MGCCQGSTISTNDQVYVHESRNKQDSEFQSLISSSRVIENLKHLNSEQFGQSFPPEDFLFFYLLGEKIDSIPYGERFSCIHSPTDTLRELTILKKDQMNLKDIERTLDIGQKFIYYPHENIVKVLYIGEDDKSINIVTEFCGKHSLFEQLKVNRIEVPTVFKYISQIMQGVMQIHKNGQILRYLTVKDVFFIDGLIKVSPFVMVNHGSCYSAPEAELSLKNDVWSIGVILLQLLTGLEKISNTQEAIQKAESIVLHSQDIQMIQKLLSSLTTRPSLLECMDYKWSLSTFIENPSCSSAPTKISKTNCGAETVPEDLPRKIEEIHENMKSYSNSNNEFYQSNELYHQIKIIKLEEVDCEYNEITWQEVDMSSPTHIKICEILNDEMKEIIESSPDHEVSSIENISQEAGTVMKTTAYSPCERPVSEQIALIHSDKSSVNFTLTESPICNDLDFKSEDHFLFNSPNLIEEDSCEFSKDIEDSQNTAIKLAEKEYSMQTDSLEQVSKINASPINLRNISGLSYENSEEHISGKSDAIPTELGNFKENKNCFQRSSTVSCPKLERRITRVFLSDEKILKAETGRLKFYSFKKRFGFITCDSDNSEVFLCEDELALSGIKMRHIKTSTLRKTPLLLKFSVLEYVKDGVVSKKAVDIKIIDT